MEGACSGHRGIQKVTGDRIVPKCSVWVKAKYSCCSQCDHGGRGRVVVVVGAGGVFCPLLPAACVNKLLKTTGMSTILKMLCLQALTYKPRFV